MKYDKSVYRSLTLITQFGINMLVPIFLCTIAGIFLGKRFSAEWIVIPLFLVGALAGFRNIFIMAKKIYSQESPSRRRGSTSHRESSYGDAQMHNDKERDENHAEKD